MKILQASEKAMCVYDRLLLLFVSCKRLQRIRCCEEERTEALSSSLKGHYGLMLG